MTTLLFLSILTAASYVVADIIVRWRCTESGDFATRINAAMPGSLSAMVYLLPAGRWRWLWSAWLAMTTLLMSPALTSAMSATWCSSLLADATIVCLAMTAALPLLPGYHNRLHTALGIAAGLLSQVCVVAICPWFLILWVLMVSVAIDAWIVRSDVCRWYDQKGVFIAEVICAAAVYLSLITDVI